MAYNAEVEALQLFLNAHGASPQLLVDGKGGEATEQAVLQVFANTGAPAITPEEELQFAKRLGDSNRRRLRAVAITESNGSGFGLGGRAKLLWERHYFFKRFGFKLAWTLPNAFIANPVPGGYTLDADHDGINDSWEKLAAAARRSPVAAFESASWGKFQVMGAWWKKLGYASVFEFAWAMTASEAGHYEALVRYIECFGLRRAFLQISERPVDCEPFADGYNGHGFRKFSYHQRIASAFKVAKP